jgi:hypothetical protein
VWLIMLAGIRFDAVGRRQFDDDTPWDSEPGESGCKDTVITCRGETTMVTALSDVPGLYVWRRIVGREGERPAAALPGGMLP